MRLIFALCIAVNSAVAAPICFGGCSLVFDGLQDQEQVSSYYDGGFGGLGSGPGPLFGISFTDGLAADLATIASGPSARLTAPFVTMNLGSPWDGPISFYFVGTGVVSFYSDLNAGGNLVNSYALSDNPFFPFGEEPGTFQSVVFNSSTGLQLDSITFGGNVIPEPSSPMLLLLGIASIGCLHRLGWRSPG